LFRPGHQQDVLQENEGVPGNDQQNDLGERPQQVHYSVLLASEEVGEGGLEHRRDPERTVDGGEPGKKKE
jgi:hypothetical protein